MGGRTSSARPRGRPTSPRFRARASRFLPRTIGLLALTACLYSPAVKADSLVVTTCSTLPKTYPAGATRLDTVDVNGNKCINGNISVTSQPVTSAQITNTVNNPVVENVAQFGGANVVTGTGASGAGIPRVTVANDSTVNIGGQPIAVSGNFSTTVTSATIANTVNNPVVDNVAQFGGANVVTGTGNSGAGIPRVTVASDSGIGITSIASIASGAFADGALTTEGARGDAVYGGSGSATMNSVLKGVYAVISNIYSFFSNGANLVGTVNPSAANWGLGTVGSSAVATAQEIASVASSSELNKATAGNIQYQLLDLAGKQVVSPHANRENFIAGSVSTSSSGLQALIATPANSTLSYRITDLACTRNDAGTTAITVTDNSVNTAGAQGGEAWSVPNSGGGGGFAKQFGVPIKIAAGTAFQINISAGVLSLMCNAQGYIGY